MDDQFIDPETFPFTEPELREALALVFERERAERDAATHAAAMRREVIERTRFRRIVADAQPDPTRALPMDGSAVAGIGYGMYVWYAHDALALLSLVSDTLAQRVTAHRAERQAEARPGRVRSALWRTTGRLDLPVPPEVEAQLAREDAASERAWQRTVRKMKRQQAAGRRA